MGRAQISVRSSTKVWDDLKKRVAETSELECKIGILAENGADKAHGDSGLSILEIAAIHEYGSFAAGLPERSFIRKTLELRRTYLILVFQKLIQRFLQGSISYAEALEYFGQKAVSEMRKTITSRKVTPPSTQETNERKGSTTTLVDTGQLINAISYVVVPK